MPLRAWWNELSQVRYAPAGKDHVAGDALARRAGGHNGRIRQAGRFRRDYLLQDPLSGTPAGGSSQIGQGPRRSSPNGSGDGSGS
jgi:hypothetical protein